MIREFRYQSLSHKVVCILYSDKKYDSNTLSSTSLFKIAPLNTINMQTTRNVSTKVMFFRNSWNSSHIVSHWNTQFNKDHLLLNEVAVIICDGSSRNHSSFCFCWHCYALLISVYLENPEKNFAQSCRW